MPRTARIDSPGLLQHVIVRGIERRAIFADNLDRSRFVKRFGTLLTETGTDCYAWALLPNHVHLLLRCHQTELSRFMRRLLTGYAIYFNCRHQRSGHLFQNRYKSIVCDADVYLLELIRYIHLNPLRAGVVDDLHELEGFPWCGHGVLLGKNTQAGQLVSAVLQLFGNNVAAARSGYRQFIADGLAMGRRPELVGGGPSALPAADAGDDKRVADRRILGSDAFVDTLRREQAVRERIAPRLTLDELAIKVSSMYNLPADAIMRRRRNNASAEARAVYCHLAVRTLGFTAAAVGRHLHVGSSAINRAVARGGEYLQGSAENDDVDRLLKL